MCSIYQTLYTSVETGNKTRSLKLKTDWLIDSFLSITGLYLQIHTYVLHHDICRVTNMGVLRPIRKVDLKGGIEMGLFLHTTKINFFYYV